MKIIALSDLHGDIVPLGSVAKALVAADVVLLVGDLTHFLESHGAGFLIRILCREGFRVERSC